jgi:hypothetical protein
MLLDESVCVLRGSIADEVEQVESLAPYAVQVMIEAAFVFPLRRK